MKKGRLEDLGVDGSTALKFIGQIEGEGLDWIHLAQHKNKWRAVVNVVLNRRVP